MNVLLRRTRQIFTLGKGILALDTPPTVLAARFRAAAVVPAEPTIRAYRAMLLDTPELAATASGVVLAPEAFEPPPDGRMTTSDALRAAGILAGVRADTGCETMSTSSQDWVTSGVDGLATRLSRLRDLGADFAVWSVCTSTAVDAGTMRALIVNSHAAARFASMCQDFSLVPLIRVGTRMSTATHDRRLAALAAALLSVCEHLDDMDVDRSATVITTWCIPPSGQDPAAAGPLAVLPPDLGGVALTTAGSEAVGVTGGIPVTSVRSTSFRWPVTFYLGREATRPALLAWRGRAAAVAAGQRALRARLATASAAFAEVHHPLHAVTAPSGQRHS